MDIDLLIAGASARAATESALRGGRLPAAVDRFADQDLAAVAPVQLVTDMAANLAAALDRWPGTPWLYTGGLENQPNVVEQVSQDHELLGIGADTLRALQRPKEICRFLQGKGVAAPDVQSESPTQAEGWLQKPLFAAGGSGIRFVADEDHAPARAETFFQRWVPGSTASALFIANSDECQLLGVTRQLVGVPWCGGGRFAYCGSIGPWRLPSPIDRQVQRMGTLLTRQYRLVGLFGIDLVIDPQQAWFIELNPRYCASAEVLEWAWGESLVGWHIRACREGMLPAPRKLSAQQRGKVILFSPTGCIVPQQWPRMLPSTLPRNPRFGKYADIPAAGTVIATGQPVITVFEEAATAGLVEEKLRKEIEQLGQQIQLASPLNTN